MPFGSLPAYFYEFFFYTTPLPGVEYGPSQLLH